MDVRASLMYLKDLPIYEHEKLYELWRSEVPSGLRRTNCEFFMQDNVLIFDARTKLEEIGLNKSGFCYLNHTSSCLPSSEDLVGTGNPDRVTQYLLETVDMVKSTLEADNVICFDWRYRESKARVKQSRVFDDIPAERQRVYDVGDIIHSDDSAQGGIVKLNRYLTKEELEEFHDGKWKIRIYKSESAPLGIFKVWLTSNSVWRPIIALVEDAPLALCDVRTVLPEDFLPVDKVHDNFVGENNYLKFNKKQRWYYLSKQTCHEPCLFLTWDSEAGPDSPITPPHAAFDNPLAQEEAQKRKSIEIRVLVMHRK